eukprot:SAG31_NODE_17734_length_659_cov_1.533929_2_plen_42_part_01
MQQRLRPSSGDAGLGAPARWGHAGGGAAGLTVADSARLTMVR